MNPMKTKLSKQAVMGLMPAALLALASCSSTPTPTGPPVVNIGSPFTHESGYGGEVVVDSVSRIATVVSVDRVKRLVVLKRANGSQSTYKALPGALGFDSIKPGDVVKVSVADQRRAELRQAAGSIAGRSEGVCHGSADPGLHRQGHGD